MSAISTRNSLCLFCVSTIFTSCAMLTPREEPALATLQSNIANQNSPAWARDRLNPQWWKTYGDSELNQDIACAFEKSPALQVIAARLAAADAQVAVAKATAWPSLNLGYGFRFGRAKEPNFGPYDLKPWTGSANLKWELDIFRKLARARESAEFSRRAVFLGSIGCQTTTGQSHRRSPLSHLSPRQRSISNIRSRGS